MRIIRCQIIAITTAAATQGDKFKHTYLFYFTKIRKLRQSPKNVIIINLKKTQSLKIVDEIPVLCVSCISCKNEDILCHKGFEPDATWV